MTTKESRSNRPSPIVNLCKSFSKTFLRKFGGGNCLPLIIVITLLLSGRDARIQAAPGGMGNDVAQPATTWTPSFFANGLVTVLVLIVDFPDEPGTVPISEIIDSWNNNNPQSNFTSVKRYYSKVSCNHLDLNFQVEGYYHAQYSKSYYASAGSGELVDEAMNGVNCLDIDYSAITRDRTHGNDFFVVYMLYAGNEEIWQFPQTLRTVPPGRYVYSFSALSTNAYNPVQLHIREHELGHALFVWPELYDLGNDSVGVSGYCLMGLSGDIPCAPLRAWNGWINVAEINGLSPETYLTLPNDASACLRYSRPGSATEYFMIESASRLQPPQPSLLVWHVDELGWETYQQMWPDKNHHYQVSLEQADGLYHLEFNHYPQLEDEYQDIFNPQTTFDDNTYPNSKWWDRTSSGLSISEIAAVDPNTTRLKISSSGLVAHYRFDEGSGATFYDSTAQNNHGTLYGAHRVPGQQGGAIRCGYLPGLQYAEVPHDVSLEPHNSLTISAWVKPTGVFVGGGLVCKGSSVSPYALLLAGDGSIRFSANRNSPFGGQGYGTWNSSVKLALNTWNHVAITYDGTTLSFYLNGIRDTQTIAVDLVFGIALLEKLYLGYDPLSDRNFPGYLDEVKIYARALSESELQGLPVEPFSVTGLSASYDGIFVITNSVVDFDWGANRPDQAITSDHYTITWSGSIIPQYSELYTLYVESDGGVSLIVNNETVLSWAGENIMEHPFIAGKPYNIVLTYTHSSGNMHFCKLFWSSPSQPKEIIPQNRLTTVVNPPNIAITGLTASPICGNGGEAYFTVAQTGPGPLSPVLVKLQASVLGWQESLFMNYIISVDGDSVSDNQFTVFLTPDHPEANVTMHHLGDSFPPHERIFTLAVLDDPRYQRLDPNSQQVTILDDYIRLEASDSGVKVHLSWNASRCASSYTVWRNGDNEFADPISATTFDDTTAMAGIAYTYQVFPNIGLPSNEADIVPVNDPPVFTPASGSITFTEKSLNNVSIAPSVSIADDSSITQMVVQVTSQPRCGGMLGSQVSGLTYTWASGMITYSGLGTAAQYSQALHSVVWKTTSYNPPPTESIIIYALDQYGARSADVPITVNINAINDPPGISVPYGVAVYANSPVNFNGSVSVFDPDANSNPVQLSLTAQHGAMTLSRTTGLSFSSGDGAADTAMIFTGAISDINAALNGMSFMPEADFAGMASIAIVANDLGYTGSGGPLTGNNTLNIDVLCTAPLITTQPQNISANDGDWVAFTVVSTGPGLSYQWQKYGANIEGANSSSLDLHVTVDDDGSWCNVTVSNQCGEAYSETAYLSVSLTSPSINTQPQSQTVAAGSTVVFEVQATGGWLSYQWQCNGSDIPGETSPTLTLTDVQPEISGSYYSVLVYNSSGYTWSESATLTVEY